MKIAIIEDEYLVSNYIETILIKNGFQVVGISDNYESAIELIELQPTVCLVDIRLMDNDNGIDVGKVLNEKQIPFIYLTANNELTTIKEAVKTRPQAYLTKPFSERDIVAALELIRVQIKATKCLELKTAKGKIEVLFDDILYLEADNVYTKIVTKHKNYTERATLKRMGELLDENFIRVHRSFIVNKTKITSKKASFVYINSVEIPFSKNYRINL